MVVTSVQDKYNCLLFKKVVAQAEAANSLHNVKNANGILDLLYILSDVIPVALRYKMNFKFMPLKSLKTEQHAERLIRANNKNSPKFRITGLRVSPAKFLYTI